MTSMSSNGDPNTSTTILVGIVGAILVFVTIVGLEALFYNAEQAENVAKVYQRDPEELTRLRADQIEQLHGYRWIDRDKGVVAIPIDRAMDLIVREAAEGRAAPASQAVTKP